MYTTLSISAAGIRLLSVRGRQVKKWGEAPLAPGLVRDGLVLQPKEVGAAIGSLFESAKVPKERVIISLAGLSFTYRILSLPRMKPALLEEAIQRGARREIPLPLDELYLSWQAIGSRPEELDYFVLGVPRKLIDALVQALEEAGIKPYIIDLKSLALARAANRENALIVDLEPDCFDIVLVADGTPAVLHTMTPRGEGASPEDNIRRLSSELSKTMEFYNSSHQEKPLSSATPLLLTGELAADPDTARLVQAEIECPIELLIPPLEFPPALPLALYAANMGLALKKIPARTTSKADATRFHDINLNILSGKYRAKARPISVRYVLLRLALIIVVALLFPIYQIKSQADAETMRLQAELGGVSEELRQVQLAGNEVKQVEDIISETLAEVEMLKNGYQGILSKGGDFAGNLKLVTDVLPPEACFASVEMGTGRIVVRGEADSPFTVVSYVITLEAQERFPEVRIAEIGETEANGVSFTVVISK